MSAHPRRPVILLALATIAASACTELPRAAWQLRFENDTLQARALFVRSTVFGGTCDSGAIVYQADTVLDVPSPPPPLLDPGSYCLEGRARDSSCNWFAEGRLDIALPVDDGTILTVVLRSGAESAECDASACMAGLCAGEPSPDGGSG